MFVIFSKELGLGLQTEVKINISILTSLKLSENQSFRWQYKQIRLFHTVKNNNGVNPESFGSVYTSHNID